MPRKVSVQDRASAKEMFQQGIKLLDIVSRLEGRVSASWLSKVSREENWLKGLLPESDLNRGEPQIYESANASPQEMAANTSKMTEVQLRRWAEQKGHLAAKLGRDAERVLDQIFATHVVKEVKTVGMGGGVQDLRMVEVVLTEPTPTDKKHLATTLAILIDKASLLSGDATSRVETSSLTKEQVADRLKHVRDELAKRRKVSPVEAEEATG
jgi:hypothetical protein